MSIYSGLEATIRLLRSRLGKANDRIKMVVERNAELSDRIELDLNPRIMKLMTELRAFDEMNNKLREERDSFEASDRSACMDYEEMLKANDGLQTRIDALKLALIALA